MLFSLEEYKKCFGDNTEYKLRFLTRVVYNTEIKAMWNTYNADPRAGNAGYDNRRSGKQ